MLNNNNKSKEPRKRPCDLVVVRVNAAGDLVNSKPCLECFRLLRRLRQQVRRVFYSTDNGTLQMERVSQMLAENHRLTKSARKKLSKR